MNRICKHCGIEKQMEDFPILKTIYRRHICKTCHNNNTPLYIKEYRKEYIKEWRQNNPDKHKKYQELNRHYREQNPKGLMLVRARKNAKEKGLEFSLQKEDLNIPIMCPVLGLELTHLGTDRNSSPSLDRFDSSKGYTLDNVNIISWRANNIKGDATLEELEKLVTWMKQQKEKQNER